jgi:hypothetical protein
VAPKDRKSVIEAIKTPLGFFSLVVLVLESVLGTLAFSLKDRSLGYVVGGILVFMVILVFVASIFRPEALWGKRATITDELFAAGLGEEFYIALDGYYSNLKDNEREEAYELLRQTINSSPHINSADQKRFCAVLAEAIVRKATLTKKWGGRH